jgi:3'-5' exoribonuclease
MKSTFIADLQPNQDATSFFLVQSKDVRQKRTGEPYLSLSLADRTGEIEAKMWDNVADVMDTFDRDDFVKAKGRVQVFQNRLQFTIHKLRRADESEVAFEDFFAASERDPEEMFAELREVVAGVGNPHLKALLEAVLADEEIAARLRRAPAAKSVHHAYLGGLLEHVLSLCQLCRLAAAQYKFVDLDLLLAGAILHDIGKVYELAFRRSFHYTDDGQLLGHIVLGLRILDDKVRLLPDFPPRLRNLLAHLIISHHGELEFGSPKVPLFAEAVLLHHLDNMDAKMEAVRSLLRKDPLLEGCWTAYFQPLDRMLLKTDRYLRGEEGVNETPPAEPGSNAGAGKPATAETLSLFGEKLKGALEK